MRSPSMKSLVRVIPVVALALTLLAGCRSRTDQSEGTVLLSVSDFDELPVQVSVTNGPYQIGQITPQGQISEFDIPTPCDPAGITVGPDHNLWFAEHTGYRVGNVTLQGQVTGFPIIDMASLPESITAGPDGNLWFTATTPIGFAIGRVRVPSFTVDVFQLPSIVLSPAGITAGPDGNIWVSDSVTKSFLIVQP